MSVHYPSWAITNNNPTSGTIQWKYSNGNPILLNQYDPSTPADYWTTALYQINGGGWYTATSTTYPVSSLSPGDTIQYAIVWWDYASDVGSTSSSNYRISSYTRPSPDPIPSLPTNINISSITSNSAYVTWTIGSYATYTCVRLYRTSDNALLVDSGTGGSSYSLTGLAQNTQYYLTFRSDNYTGVSSWSSTYYFTTTSANAPTDCSIYLDTDGSFMIYTQDSSVTRFDYYDQNYTNTWVTMPGFEGAGSHTYGNGYVSWVKRAAWVYVSDVGKPLITSIQGRAYNSAGYTYSNSVANPYNKCRTPNNPTLSSDGTNVNIVWPTWSGYTSINQYSVDEAVTWNTATSSTYPLSSLDNATGKKIYVRTKYTWSGRPDSDWAYGNYQEPTCPGVGNISISERADASNIDITISSIPAGYRLYIEYQERGYNNWYPVQQSTTSYSTTNYTTSLNCNGIPSGTVITVRAYLGQSHYFDGSPTSSNTITYTQGTCPTPNTLTATFNPSTGKIDIYVAADSGYFIQVLYNTGSGNNSLTNGYSPINYNFDVSSIGNGVTVTIYAYCTKTYYNDSSWVSASVYLNRRPSCNIFNFTAGQQMTAQNIIKGANGQYTADAIVMPYSTWNSFTSKINEFRTYYSNKYSNIGQYGFTTVGSGTIFTASIYNEAKNAINGMFDTYEQLPAVTSGVSEITATVLMNLQTKLNMVS